MPHQSNQILRLLSTSDLALLSPMTEVDTALRQILEPAQTTIETIYFMESGFASVVADASSSHPVEIGLIGPEGMTGLALVLEDTQSPFETYIQAAGSAWKVEAPLVRAALAQSATLNTVLLRYARSFLTQVATTAAANARSSIEARLARWLLMVEDRMGDSYPMTHQLLSIMLAVNRPGVTIALQALEARALIKATRGHIEITDRVGLIAASRGSYGLSETELRRIYSGVGLPSDLAG